MDESVFILTLLAQAVMKFAVMEFKLLNLVMLSQAVGVRVVLGLFRLGTLAKLKGLEKHDTAFFQLGSITTRMLNFLSLLQFSSSRR